MWVHKQTHTLITEVMLILDHPALHVTCLTADLLCPLTLKIPCSVKPTLQIVFQKPKTLGDSVPRKGVLGGALSVMIFTAPYIEGLKEVLFLNAQSPC